MANTTKKGVGESQLPYEYKSEYLKNYRAKQAGQSVAPANSNYEYKSGYLQQYRQRQKQQAAEQAQLEQQMAMEAQAPRKATLRDLTLGSIGRGYASSRYGNERYDEIMLGTQRQAKQAQKAKKKLEQEKYNFEAKSKAGQAISGAGELLGQIAYNLTNKDTLGAVGANVAGASAVGAVVPLPEELVTIPVAVGRGLKMGSAATSFQVSAAQAYDEMLEAGVSPKTAKTVANVIGGGVAALDAMQVDELAKGFKLAKNAKTEAGEKAAANIAKALAKVGKSTAIETGQEVAQEAVTMVGQDVAKRQEGIKTFSGEEYKQRLGDTAVQSALSFGLLGGAGAVGGAVMNRNNIKAQTNEAESADNEAENTEKGASNVEAKEKPLALPQYATKPTLYADEDGLKTSLNERETEVFSEAFPDDREIENSEMVNKVLYAANKANKDPVAVAESNFKAAETDLQAYLEQTVAEYENFVGEGVSVNTETNERMSNNPQWYREYYAKNKKAPSKAEKKAIGEKMFWEDVAKGGGTYVPPEIAKRYNAFKGVAEQLKGLPLDTMFVGDNTAITSREGLKPVYSPTQSRQAVVDTRKFAVEKRYGQQGKTALNLLNNATEDRLNEFDSYYRAGAAGQQMPKLDGTLSKNESAAVFMAGVADTKANKDAYAKKNVVMHKKAGLDENTATHLTKRDRVILNKLGKALGIRISFADNFGKGENAYYNPATAEIVINRKAADPYKVACSHEIIHRLRQTSPNEFYSFAEAVLDVYSKDSRFETDFKEKAEAYKLDKGEIEYYDLLEEVVADYMSHKATTDEMVQMLSAKPTLAEKFIEILKDIIYKLNGIKEKEVQTVKTELEALLEKAIQASEKAVAEQRTKGDTAANGNEKKYSFGGISSANAPNTFLRAERLAEFDTDNETIRQETGWFKGADGKWRFEIDDSKATVSYRGDLEQNKNPEYREYQELFNAFYIEMEDRSDAEFERFKELDKKFTNAKKDLRLKDYMQHDELYRQYPKIAEIPVAKITGTTNGRYDGVGIQINENHLRPGYEKHLKETLLHEVQHIIQETEGFAGGASTKYWTGREGNRGKTARELYLNTAGEQESRDVEKRMNYTAEQRRAEAPFTGDENTVFVEDAEYSAHISNTAEQEINKALADKNYRQEIKLRDFTPAVLVEHGARDLPMLMKASHLRENIFTAQEAAANGLRVNAGINYHGLGKSLFMQVVDSLDNPQRVYRGTKNADNSSRRENYFLIISTVKDKDGNPINIPVYIEQQGRYNNVAIDTNKIATVYGKENINNYINKELRKGNIVKINKSSDKSNGLSPIDSVKDSTASMDNIPQAMKNDNGNKLSDLQTGDFGADLRPKVHQGVKYSKRAVNSDGDAVSDQQAEYFKNSVARDNQGRLLNLYHQTNADFTEFNIKSTGAGRYDDAMPDGVFLKPTAADIGLKGKKQMELYANITNPLQFRDRGEMAKYWKRNIDGYADIQKQIEDVDVSYQQKYDTADLLEDEQYKKIRKQLINKEITAEQFRELLEETETKKILAEWTATSNNLRAKAKELINEYIADNDFDGIILENDAGSFGRNVKSYVVFNSNQIKNTDNLMPTENLDIRYSKKREPDIPDGHKERGFNESVRTKSDYDEVVQQEFIDNPEIYKQLANKVTKEKAKAIMDKGIAFAETEFPKLLERMDATAIALGDMMAREYSNMGEYDKAVTVIRDMARQLTKAGQFSQAAVIALTKSNPMTALAYAKRDIDKLNVDGHKQFGKKWKDFEITADEEAMFENIKQGDADAIKKAYEVINKRIEKEYPSTIWQKFVEASRISMLLNPRTNVKNVVSNLLLYPITRGSGMVSAGMQKAYQHFNKNYKQTQSAMPVKKDVRALAEGVWEDIKDTLDTTNKYNEGIKANKRDIVVFKEGMGTRVMENIAPGTLHKLNSLMKKEDAGLMETLRHATYYFLEWGDNVFVKQNFISRLGSYLQANNITDLKQLSEEDLKGAIAVAYKEALRATFKDDTALSKWMASIKHTGNPYIDAMMEMIMPFTKTPANIAMRGIDYSPIGFINTLNKYKKSGDLDELFDELGKNTLGTALIAFGMWLFGKGLVTGGEPENEKQAAFLKQQGWQPYAVKTPNGNYATYDWAQPAAIPIIMGVTIAESLEEGRLGVVDAVKNAGVASFNQWIELSPLQSLKEVMGGYDSVGENLLNTAIEMPQRLIPSALGATARTTDTTQRVTYSKGNVAQTQKDIAKSKVPGLSQTLPAAYDTWGREKKRDDSTFGAAISQYINPSTYKKSKSTEVDAEIDRLYEAVGDSAVYPRKASYSIERSGKKYTLSNKEYSEYQRIMGELSYDGVKALMEKPAYSSLTDTEKAEIIKDIYDNAFEKAKFTIMEGQGYEKTSEDIRTAKETKIKQVYMEATPENTAEYYIAYYILNNAESDKASNGKTIAGSKKKNGINRLVELGFTRSRAKKLYEAMH